MSEELPLWQKVIEMFARFGAPAPPWRLRDEIVGLYSDKARLQASLAAANERVKEQEAVIGVMSQGCTDMCDVLRRIQDTLASHVDPGGDLQDPLECVNALLDIADHRDTLAKQRAALHALTNAPARASAMLKIVNAALKWQGHNRELRAAVDEYRALQSDIGGQNT